MEQTDNDIFPEKEKEKAKRKKIAEMNAVTSQAILKIILAQLGVKYEQYHLKIYCVLIIPIGEGGIEIRLLDSAIVKQRQTMQDKLAKLFDFISGGASLGEVVTYCRDNRIVYLGYEAKKYAITDETSLKHNDSSFESVFVPEGVASIGEDAFLGCSRLVSINVDSNNPVYDSRENCNAIIETATNTLIVGCQNTVIPAGVTSIGEGAFYRCESLESIQLPKGLQSIGSSAFSGCTSLESIQLPEGVTSIGNFAFWGCKSLKSIQLSEGVTSIGNSAFKDCSSLKSITYSGTREQWGMIKKGRDWHSYIPAKVVHCTDGETEI